jgi:hypothetical protein
MTAGKEDDFSVIERIKDITVASSVYSLVF